MISQRVERYPGEEGYHHDISWTRNEYRCLLNGILVKKAVLMGMTCSRTNYISSLEEGDRRRNVRSARRDRERSD